MLARFHLEDSTTKLLNNESSAMSRMCRSFIFLVFHKLWKVCGADTADAFSQGMDLENLAVEMYSDPTGDVRRRTARTVERRCVSHDVEIWIWCALFVV